MINKIAAWSVHAFTASGLLAAFMAMLAAVEKDWRECMLWLLLCLVIDGIDGTFARMAKVREVLPHVQGKYIDYVIDFFTYVILPAYIFYEVIELPPTLLLLCSFAMLLSSGLYYGIENMTSPDGKHFVGFPAMWNMVVYLLVFVVPGLNPYIVAAIIFFLALLHFAPVLFAYPSMGGRWWPATLSVTVVFIVSALINVWFYPEPVTIGRWAAIICSGYYAVLAVIDTFYQKQHN